MKILVIGSGGREHAICKAFAKSSRVSKLYCAPGNAGIAAIAECVPIKPEKIERLADYAKQNEIDLTFVGGETPLALGIVDEFEHLGLRIVGASKAAAELEASKSFAKAFMVRHGIPTAKFRTAFSQNGAITILDAGEFGDDDSPVVIKADGLAAGKGVVVAVNRAEAIKAIREMENLAGAAAASTFVIEEGLFGRDVSLIFFADGEHFALMPPTRDHKRIGEGDTGPNTGGMGTITDASLLSPDQIEQIIREIIEPTLKGCRGEGFPFRGILFLGLMITKAGPMLLEYNVRFGDPETQSILVRLETGLVDICEAMLSGRLAETKIKWRPGNSATIVLAAKGYPQSPRTGDAIHGLDAASAMPGVTVFHAGTKSDSGAVAAGFEREAFDASRTLELQSKYITSGGRVLGVTAVADSLDEAIVKAYAAVKHISWDGMQYRRDIGM
ncbi:MAG: phosphoribosylamine--glycine ligase [Blastocatellia bacterium]